VTAIEIAPLETPDEVSNEFVDRYVNVLFAGNFDQRTVLLRRFRFSTLRARPGAHWTGESTRID